MAPLQLPVIDFSPKKLSSESWSTTCSEVVSALEEYGVFVAIYDGVSEEVDDAIFLASRDLFDLPTEVKVQNKSDKPNHAYIGPFPESPLYESLGIENSTSEEGVEIFTKLMWPTGNEGFRTSAFNYSKAVAELEKIVLRMIAKSYEIEEHYESMLGSLTHVLRFQKYSCPKVGQVPGLHPHIDKTLFTTLHERDTKGLEIQTKDGNWIQVDPLPSSFVVMTGEAATAWTKGRISGPTHRVGTLEFKERYSLGLFTFVWDLTSLPSVPQKKEEIQAAPLNPQQKEDIEVLPVNPTAA